MSGDLATVAASLNVTGFVLEKCGVTSDCSWIYTSCSDPPYANCNITCLIIGYHCNIFFRATMLGAGTYTSYPTCDPGGGVSFTVAAGHYAMVVELIFWAGSHTTCIVFKHDFSSKPDCSAFSSLSLSFFAQNGYNTFTAASEPVMLDGSGATLTIDCTA